MCSDVGCQSHYGHERTFAESDQQIYQCQFGFSGPIHFLLWYKTNLHALKNAEGSFLTSNSAVKIFFPKNDLMSRKTTLALTSMNNLCPALHMTSIVGSPVELH